MKMNCYYVRNKLSCLSDGIMLFPTDAFAVSQVTKKLISSNESLNDYELHKIACFNTETSELSDIDDILISFNSREVFENPPIDTSPKEVLKDINSVR